MLNPIRRCEGWKADSHCGGVDLGPRTYKILYLECERVAPGSDSSAPSPPHSTLTGLYFPRPLPLSVISTRSSGNGWK